MYTLYNVKVYLSSIFCYIISTLDNVEVRDEATDTRHTGEKGQDKVLAVYSTGAQLSEFQQNGEQSNQRYQIRKYASAVRYFGMHAQ